MTATTLTLDAAEELTAEEGDSEVVIEAVIVPEGDPTLTLGGEIVIRAAGDWVADGFRQAARRCASRARRTPMATARATTTASTP